MEEFICHRSGGDCKRSGCRDPFRCGSGVAKGRIDIHVWKYTWDRKRKTIFLEVRDNGDGIRDVKECILTELVTQNSDTETITTGGKGSVKECHGLQYAFWIKTKRSGGVTKSFHGSQDHAREHAPDCIRMRWDESSNSGPKVERIVVSDGETCPFCSTRERMVFVRILDLYHPRLDAERDRLL